MSHPLIPAGYDFPDATPRLPYADVHAPEVKPIWDQLGFVQDNLFRMLAHAPTTFGAMGSLFHALLGNVDLSLRDRELAIMHVDHVLNARYGWAWHFSIAKDDGGLSELQLDLLHRGEITDPGFSDDDRALLKFVDEQVRHHVVTDATFAAVKARLSARQLVELLVVIGAYTMIGNIMETLQLQLEWEPATELGRTPRAK